jgi:signal transduction histidine kinase
MDIETARPIYKNLYTMNKYNGESLTTYEPRGPWAQTHQDLSKLVDVHIDNVHILANLEPWRWSSPDFVQKAIKAMHNVHGANGLHLYPQASFWDYPYTAEEDGMAIVSVKDSGCGIDEENQRKLLHTDTHFSTFGTNNEEGSGLGLLLCKDFVIKNGGKLWFTSKKGEGSTFSFSIPLLDK